MRAFLAFEVSDEVIGRLVHAGEELRRTGADVGVVARQNLHFTVKFLGEIPEEAVKQVDGRLEKLGLSGFEADVRGIGVFPDLRRPRIVWAGVAGEGEERMTQAAESVIEALEGIGKPEERDFRAHLTIGRVRSPRNLPALASFVTANSSSDFGTTPVRSLKLKSSVLTPGGPVYSDVREYAMR